MRCTFWVEIQLVNIQRERHDIGNSSGSWLSCGSLFFKRHSTTAGEQGLIHGAELNYALYCEYYSTFKCDACPVFSGRRGSCSYSAVDATRGREGQREGGREDETTLQHNMPFFFSSMFMCRILGPIFTAWVKITLCNIWEILCKLV